MKLIDVVYVAVGAGVGGALRYVLGGVIAERWGAALPWHTFAINVSGAFLLGILMSFGVEKGYAPQQLTLLLGVGVLGGFTTFSTLSYESVMLVQEGYPVQGMAYMFGSAVAGMAAATLGLYLGRI